MWEGEWKFLTGTDWPDVVKVEVFWRWIMPAQRQLSETARYLGRRHVIPISKVPWVTVATPEEGDTFPAGPSVLVAVKSSIAKKPTTVRLEVHKKVGGKWTWAPPGAIDLAWASFPFNLPATQGDYRIREKGADNRRLQPVAYLQGAIAVW